MKLIEVVELSPERDKASKIIGYQKKDILLSTTQILIAFWEPSLEHVVIQTTTGHRMIIDGDLGELKTKCNFLLS